MKQDILKHYLNLRESLEQERAEITARLVEIEAALREGVPRPGRSIEVQPSAGIGHPRGARAVGRKASAAAAKARWAKVKATGLLRAVEKEAASAVRTIVRGRTADLPETINRCRSCGKPAVAGDDYCYSCQ